MGSLSLLSHLFQCLDFPSLRRIGLLGPRGLWSQDILYKNAISTFSFLAGLQLPESTVCGRAKTLAENQTSREMHTCAGRV